MFGIFKTFDIQPIWEYGAGRRWHNIDIDGFCDLPGFNEHPHALPHEDHPACFLVVVQQVKEDDELDKHIGDNLGQIINLWRYTAGRITNRPECDNELLINNLDIFGIMEVSPNRHTYEFLLAPPMTNI